MCLHYDEIVADVKQIISHSIKSTLPGEDSPALSTGISVQKSRSGEKKKRAQLFLVRQAVYSSGDQVPRGTFVMSRPDVRSHLSMAISPCIPHVNCNYTLRTQTHAAR